MDTNTNNTNTTNTTNGNGGITPTTIDKETAGMGLKIDAHVRLIAPISNLLAFASVRIEDCFVVDNIKVVASDKGLFVNMPSAQDNKGNYHDICFPMTANFRAKLNAAVLDGYAAAVEKNMNIGMAQREFAEKPEIAERLEANKQKAAAHNASRPAPTLPNRASDAISA
jgi:stage V sporulation protein G